MTKPSSSFLHHKRKRFPPSKQSSVLGKKKHWYSTTKAIRYRRTAHCSSDEGIPYWNYEREYFATFRPKDSNTNIQKRLSSDGSFIGRSGGLCDWSDGLVIRKSLKTVFIIIFVTWFHGTNAALKV